MQTRMSETDLKANQILFFLKKNAVGKLFEELL
jgi:hypothetical protein